MDQFIGWFNRGSNDMDGLIRAGQAHLWFVTIHPLDDGNGRVVRAIDAADTLSTMVINKGKFWLVQAGQPPFSPRQEKVLGKLLDGLEGPALLLGHFFPSRAIACGMVVIGLSTIGSKLDRRWPVAGTWRTNF